MRWRDFIWRPRRVAPLAEAAALPGTRWHALDPGGTRGVLELAEGKVIGDARLIATAEDVALGGLQVLADVADPSGHWSVRRKRWRWPRRREGTAFALAAASGNNYYHWLVESLPRLGLLEQVPDLGAAVDCYLLNERLRPAHHESLDLLGIPRQRRVSCRKDEVLQVTRLVVPVMDVVPGECPRWAVDFLRRRLLPHAARRPLPLLYVSRQGAGRRRIRNEDALRDSLRAAGGEAVSLEALSFQEQISLFASARVIVAPHGAGLSNLLFAAAGTTLVELFAPSYTNRCYEHLAGQLSVNYRAVCGELTAPADRAHPEADDFLVSVSEIMRILDPVLQSAQSRPHLDDGNGRSAPT